MCLSTILVLIATLKTIIEMFRVCFDVFGVNDIFNFTLEKG